MQERKIRRRNFDEKALNQKRFLSIAIVFCSFATFFLGYKHFASNKYPISLRVLPKVVQNAAINGRQISSTEYDFKPLPFASVGDTGLILYFPAHVSEVLGVGFHESGKSEALPLQPVGNCYFRESTQTVSRSISLSRFPVLFVMNSRGRGQTPASAADVAMRPGTLVRSPVDGVVTKVEAYYLYGKYPDFKVEIKPQGHPELRVVVIHIDEVRVKAGDPLEAGKTELAKVRDLSHTFDSQINEYISKECDHPHIQVNRFVPTEVKK